jgi:Ser/Thr protein kinase RdoA (MazF antagonist)
MNALSDLAERLRRSSKLANTARVVEMRTVEEGVIILLENEQLTPIGYLVQTGFSDMGAAIREFHEAGDSSLNQFESLPWRHLTVDMEGALRRHGRLDEVLAMLSHVQPTNLPSVAHVVSHNDVHPGNVYFSGDRIMFLDLDDACRSDYRNDLGMALTAFSAPETTEVTIFNSARALLNGYGVSESQSDLTSMLSFALRKAVLTEAYFLFMQSHPRNVFTPRDVEAIRNRQRLLLRCYYLTRRFRI